MKDEDPLTFFPTDRRQVPKATSDPHTVILDVHTAGVNDGAPGTEKVDQEFLRPNTMVNSDDPGVVELMRKAVGNEVDPWARAVAIEKWVAKNLTDKNFGVVFANAKQVARDLSGDCTEHSVLTAAMCRAAGIPARAAVGIIYAEHLGGFGFHMWNEVYVNRRWVAIDSAFDESDVDAVHIKFSDTSLDGIAPFETFTSVVRAFDKMKIVPIETRR
jgi:transglutaminase-like putative cysteine protease